MYLSIYIYLSVYLYKYLGEESRARSALLEVIYIDTYIYMYTHLNLYIYLYTCVSISIHIYLSVYLYTYLGEEARARSALLEVIYIISIQTHLYLSIYLDTCVSIYLYLSICLFIYVPGRGNPHPLRAPRGRPARAKRWAARTLATRRVFASLCRPM